MKLVTYKHRDSNPRVGIYYDELIYDVRNCAEYLKMETPSFIEQIIQEWDHWLGELGIIYNEIKDGKITTQIQREHAGNSCSYSSYFMP